MKRVEIAPHYDWWMRGDRYGTVVRTSKHRDTGRTIAHVRLEISGKTIRVWADEVTPR